MSDSTTHPTVFISYSHDTPEHKRWVGELAAKLVDNGVDVILDQWDLGLGDDVPKFMEAGVGRADRVLMICTESYVKKADDGRGGVGYEAMIVTGELVSNLGTSKFIPVVRQKQKTAQLPKSMSTRLYIDLSEEQEVQGRFEELLRELHQQPALRKPTLGASPFKTSSPVEGSATESLSITADPRETYASALEVARRGDQPAWRRIVRQAHEPVSAGLNEWRVEVDRNPPRTADQIPAFAEGGIRSYQNLFAVVLAGLESSKDEYSKHSAVLDEILEPKDWNFSGLTVIAGFPSTVGYLFQGVHGAKCMNVQRPALAVRLVTSSVYDFSSGKKRDVWRRHELMGWPDGLGHTATTAWNFLYELPTRWTWLEEAFYSVDDYKEALVAYYLLLNILEFVELCKESKDWAKSENHQTQLEIPVCNLAVDNRIQRRAYRLLIDNPDALIEVLRRANMPLRDLKTLWDPWVKVINGFRSEVYRYGLHGAVIHAGLFDDLGDRINAHR